LVLTVNTLFVYGTLQDPGICRVLLGRMPESAWAALDGYVRLAVRGEAYPAMVPKTAGRVEGLVLTGLSEAEMAALDVYEGDEYRRGEVDVETDAARIRAWAYVWTGSPDRLCRRD
jgi:gamma-glutamylcyclotransferase (GGCT)/AIG2-like uncharacterized protein YtfP